MVAFFATVPRLATVALRAGVTFVGALRAVVVLLAVVVFRSVGAVGRSGDDRLTGLTPLSPGRPKLDGSRREDFARGCIRMPRGRLIERVWISSAVRG
jgi:hypothetical protein